MKIYHKNDCEQLLFNKKTCVYIQIGSRNTLWSKIKLTNKKAFEPKVPIG